MLTYVSRGVLRFTMDERMKLCDYHKTQNLEARCFHLLISLNGWSDAGKEKNEEFLWFSMALDLCNQRAKLLMSKSTTWTQTASTQPAHVHGSTHGPTQNKLLTYELCGDPCSCGVWQRRTSLVNANKEEIQCMGQCGYPVLMICCVSFYSLRLIKVVKLTSKV